MKNFKKEIDLFHELHLDGKIEYRDGVFIANLDGKSHRFDDKGLRLHNRAFGRFLEKLPERIRHLESRGFTFTRTVYTKGKNQIEYRDPFGDKHVKTWTKIASLSDSVSGIPRVGEKICQALVRKMCPADDWINNRRYDFLEGLELDCYSKTLGLAMEHHGQQHFERIGKQSQKDFEALQARDRKKKRILKEKGIVLLEIKQGDIDVKKYHDQIHEKLNILGIDHDALNDDDLEKTSDFVNGMVKGWYESYRKEFLEHMHEQGLDIDKINGKSFTEEDPIRPYFSLSYHCMQCGWQGSVKKLKGILEKRGGCARCRSKEGKQKRHENFIHEHSDKLISLGLEKEHVVYDTENKGQIALICPICGNKKRNLSQKAFLQIEQDWCDPCKKKKWRDKKREKTEQKKMEKDRHAIEKRMNKIRCFFPKVEMLDKDIYWCGCHYDDGTPHPSFHATLDKLTKELSREHVNLKQFCYGCYPRQGSTKKDAKIVRQLLDKIDREYNLPSLRTRTPDIIDPDTMEPVHDDMKVSTSREKYFFQCSNVSHSPFFGTMSNYLNLSKYGYCKMCVKEAKLHNKKAVT